MGQSGEPTQTSGRGKSSSGKSKGKAQPRSNSGSRKLSKPATLKKVKGTLSGTPTMTPPMDFKTVALASTSDAGRMELPAWPMRLLEALEDELTQPKVLTDAKAPEETMEVGSGQQLQQVIDATAAQFVPDNDEDVIIIKDSSDGFMGAANATHDGKQNLLHQAKRDKKAQADSKDRAAAQALQIEAAKAATVRVILIHLNQ